MLDKFWESLGSNLADEWLKHVFSPAFLFWAGGLGMYILRYGYEETWSWVTGLEVVEQATLLIVVLLILVLSSLVMKALRFDLLRLLEGYWPWPFGRLGDWRSDRKEQRAHEMEVRWNELKGKGSALTRREARELAELEMRLHYTPSDPKDAQPTALGNILRAGETIPTHKYGLDAVVCWPRLWLLLPENAREELAKMRTALMDRVELWAWGMVFVIWTIWSPVALLVGLVWMALAHRWTLQAGMSYADLIESSFDVHRWKLYEGAHWELPKNSEKEVAAGRKLTESFWRGQLDSEVAYHHSDGKVS